MALRQEQNKDFELIQKVIQRMSHRATKIKNIEVNRQLHRVEGYYPYSGCYIQDHSL